jgi:hypothetical protein
MQCCCTVLVFGQGGFQLPLGLELEFAAPLRVRVRVRVRVKVCSSPCYCDFTMLVGLMPGRTCDPITCLSGAKSLTVVAINIAATLEEDYYGH